ncbi:hypothetical protein FWD07_00105 [Candidatus Saccharibacteria bacterium]|nr:hypothetical protein [Candidatus Saccharibacteria bacterium]
MHPKKPLFKTDTPSAHDALHSHAFAKATKTASSTIKIAGANPADLRARRNISRRYQSSSVVRDHLHKSRQAKRFDPSDNTPQQEDTTDKPRASASRHATPPTTPPLPGRKYNPYG